MLFKFIDESKIKNYILWPILALLSTIAIYLVLVACIYKISITSPSMEELLWRYAVGKDFIGIYGDERGQRLQTIIDRLPPSLLPNKYPKIKIIIAKDDELNAFAAPGGRIILTTGLLNSIKSENALLFIIGHEIGHLARQDHLYEFSRLITSKIYATITWSNLVAELLMLIDNHKTKETEFLADQWALKIILHYYGHAGGINEFFNFLQSEGNKPTNKVTLSTHPEVKKRLDKINLLIEKHSIKISKKKLF